MTRRPKLRDSTVLVLATCFEVRVSHANLSLELAEKSISQVEKLPGSSQQICAEAGKCDLWRRENQHHAEQQQIHQIDHHERKKCALIAEISLILRDHPAGEREMERPRCADHRVKQSPVRLHVQKKAEHTVNGDRQNAVDREEIRRQRDPEVGLARDDVSAIAS